MRLIQIQILSILQVTCYTKWDKTKEGEFVESYEIKRMPISFTYNKDEWIKARREFLFLSGAINKFQLILIPIMILFTVYAILISEINIFSTVCMGGIIIYILVLGYAYFVVPVSSFNATKKYHYPYHLVFREDGIDFETTDIKTHLQWSVYTSYIESKKFYYLLQGKASCMILPKSVFGNEEELQRFADILMNHLERHHKSIKKK